MTRSARPISGLKAYVVPAGTPMTETRDFPVTRRAARQVHPGRTGHMLTGTHAEGPYEAGPGAPGVVQGPCQTPIKIDGEDGYQVDPPEVRAITPLPAAIGSVAVLLHRRRRGAGDVRHNVTHNAYSQTQLLAASATIADDAFLPRRVRERVDSSHQERRGMLVSEHVDMARSLNKANHTQAGAPASAAEFLLRCDSSKTQDEFLPIGRLGYSYLFLCETIAAIAEQ